MSDEEHHFESKADAGASKDLPSASRQHSQERFHCHLNSKAAPVVEVSTSKTGRHGHGKCHFVGIDIFIAKKLEDIVPSSHNCDVSLLTDDRSTNTKDDLRLPTDDSLLTQLLFLVS